MRCRRLTMAVLAILSDAVVPANANWLTNIAREAGEAGGSAASHVRPNLGAIGRAAEHLGALKNAPERALAAHATPEGHWQFVNRDGQSFTAGTPEEMKRVLPSLAPEAAAKGDGALTLYLSEDSVFENTQYLDKLPKDAELNLVTDNGAFPLRRADAAKSGSLAAEIKPHLVAELTDRAIFDEMVAYLSRPLNKSNIRTVALEPGAPHALSSAPASMLHRRPLSSTNLIPDISPRRFAMFVANRFW